MKVSRFMTVNITDGDMEIRAGKGMTSFAYKGRDMFMFRTNELEPLVAMLLRAKKELAHFDTVEDKAPKE